MITMAVSGNTQKSSDPRDQILLAKDDLIEAQHQTILSLNQSLTTTASSLKDAMELLKSYQDYSEEMKDVENN